MPWKNWAGNQTAQPRRVATPRSPEEVSALVRRAGADGLRVKAVGAGHSFTAVAVTDGVQVRPEGLTEIRSVDASAGTVTVGSGMRLERLNELLAQHGLALTNMGDIAVQSLAGATGTGTHGTGRSSGALSGQIRGLEMVLADGEIVTCSPDENAELFAGARVGLGALGIVTAITFAVEPAFLLEAREEPMPMAEVLDRFDELSTENEHFEFYWFPHTDSCNVKRNNRSAGPAKPLSRAKFLIDDEILSNGVFGLACKVGKAAPKAIPTIARLSSKALSARTYTDASYKVFTSPRRVRFVEMEYALPREAAVAALREIHELVNKGHEYVSFPVEVRVAPSDDMWLSTANGRDTAYIAVHMFRGTPHERYFSAVEKIMTAHQGRPHWGKLHTRDAAYLADAYPHFKDFTALRDRVDPERRFGNDYLRRVLGE
ncbi:D-arabinono-1,4-lactone oxidase [Yinghuangia soli]|uniref:FAD-binding protein n=1 Tax=Yinghuangia soli TaxID=2908204 RepID=A0AA41U0F7_9ACTN|nr:D-arabinono-1,4-lactone oxidase [Yinghuangia soli]MCF2526382.1 FAD-binding protein [Yinghuangia soli]